VQFPAPQKKKSYVACWLAVKILQWPAYNCGVTHTTHTHIHTPLVLGFDLSSMFAKLAHCHLSHTSSPKMIFLLLTSIFYFMAVLVFELSASYLLGRRSTTWVIPPPLFCGFYFLVVWRVLSKGRTWLQFCSRKMIQAVKKEELDKQRMGSIV
jgi:hypothetical protein